MQIVTLYAVKAPFTFTLVVLAAGCNGLIGSHGGGGVGGVGATTGALCVQGAAPTSTRVRRLTKLEIQRSATAALGIDVTSALANLDSDSAVNGTFSNSDGLVVSDSFATGLNLAAEAIGTSFKATVTRTTFSATCFSSDNEGATCADTFIRDTGRKIFRRDLTDEDVAGLKAVYMAARDVGTDGDVGDRFATGLSWVVRAMVQSPDFLYLTELGDPAVANGGKTSITSDEIASALSYSVVGLPPDDELVAAAAASQLADADARAAQVARLIAAYPDAWQQQMRQFVPQWLGINFSKTEWQKDTDALPMFSASLKSALQTEIDMLIDDWAVSSDGRAGRRLAHQPDRIHQLGERAALRHDRVRLDVPEDGARSDAAGGDPDAGRLSRQRVARRRDVAHDARQGDHAEVLLRRAPGAAAQRAAAAARRYVGAHDDPGAVRGPHGR